MSQEILTNNTLFGVQTDSRVRSPLIIESAKYLVSLYFMISETIRYECSYIKIEKLLSIANFTWLMAKGKPLFDDIMYINPCGTGFDLDWYFNSPIIESDVVLDKKPIDSNMINQNASIPTRYKSYLTDSETKRLLYNIFISFGSFPPKDIGTMIDCFKDEISRKVEGYTRNIVDPAKACAFFENKYKIGVLSKTNDLIAFVDSYKFN